MKQIVLGMTVAFTAALCAQTPKYVYGSFVKPENAKKRFLGALLPADSTEFIVQNESRSTQIFSFYNLETMKKVSSFETPTPEINGRDANILAWKYYNQKIFSIYSHYDKSSDVNTVYGKILDKKGKSILAQRKMVAVSSPSKKKVGQLAALFSKDKSKILIMREPRGAKYDNTELELSLFNDKLESIYDKNISFPYKNRQISVGMVMLSNNGRVTVIASWMPSLDEIKANPDLKNQTIFKIFGINPEKDVMDELDFTESGYHYSSLTGKENEKTGKISFTGMYRGDVSGLFKGANGIFYFELDPEKWEIDKTRFSKIDRDMMIEIFKAGNETERKEKRAIKSADRGNGLYSYELVKVLFAHDNKIKMVMESSYITQVCNTNSKTGITTCTDIYHKDQIIEFTLDESGEIVDLNTVPKKQAEANWPRKIGFIHLSLNNQDFYIYNDAENNHNPSKVSQHKNNQFYSTYVAGRNKTRLCYVKHENNGKKTTTIKKPFFDHYKQNISIIPRSFVSINPSSVITWAYLRKGKEPLLLKLYLE